MHLLARCMLANKFSACIRVIGKISSDVMSGEVTQLAPLGGLTRVVRKLARMDTSLSVALSQRRRSVDLREPADQRDIVRIVCRGGRWPNRCHAVAKKSCCYKTGLARHSHFHHSALPG